MTFSEIYYNLMQYLDKLMSIEFTACGVTFSLWGMFLTSCLFTLFFTLLFAKVKGDFNV